MRSRLPIVTRLGVGLAVALLLRGSVELNAQPSTPGGGTLRRDASSAGPLNSGRLGGRALIQQAARNLAAQPALEAQMRQTVALFDQYLVGKGSYRQWIVGGDKMFRLELNLGTKTSLLQVCDGTTLWEKRILGTSEECGYLTVRHIREAIEKSGRVSADPGLLAIGGLDQLLRGLSKTFEFEDPVAQRIGKAEFPVWEIRGSWKPNQVADQPMEDDTTDPVESSVLAEHLPHAVVITLGRDQQLPLFPYRVEYLRRIPTSDPPPPAQSASPTQYRRIATIQLYEVQRYASMDSRHFRFQIDKEAPVVDMSNRYMRRLGLR